MLMLSNDNANLRGWAYLKNNVLILLGFKAVGGLGNEKNKNKNNGKVLHERGFSKLKASRAKKHNTLKK